MKTTRLVLLLALIPLLTGLELVDGKVCFKRQVNVMTKDGDESLASKLEVKPAQISVRKGCSFRIKFDKDLEVRTFSDEDWLEEDTYTSVSPIILTVPKEQAIDVYKYDIEVKGFGKLDPRARVKN